MVAKRIGNVLELSRRVLTLGSDIVKLSYGAFKTWRIVGCGIRMSVQVATWGFVTTRRLVLSYRMSPGVVFESFGILAWQFLLDTPLVHRFCRWFLEG